MLNNNFTELVKKYEQYQSNKRRKLFIPIFGLAAIVAGGLLLVTNSDFILKSFQKTSPESNTQIQVPAVQEKRTQNEIETIQKIEEKPLERVKVATPKTEDLPNQVSKRTAKPAEKQSQFKLQVHERKSLYNLLNEHKEQESYKSAINVTQFYFDEKDYDKAVIWAVKASKKDPKQSLPWIIYAKSKASQGKTKVAKKALSIYLKHTNSKEVRDLLDTLK